jgi:dTDP-4-amino-4,6-dideoxygalactose transaminase
LGPEVEQFEQEIAPVCGSRFALGVSSGTDALLLALMGLGIGPGDEVITTPYSFFATAGSIARVGAKPVFVDVVPETFNINSHEVAHAVTSRTRAIMPVHLYGQCADMAPIEELSNRKNLPVIEDAAQAIGAEFMGRRAGSLGTAGCFSFFPTKNLGAFGDAGLVTTDDEALFHRLRVLRVHGAEPKYYHHEVGANFRIDAIQAAVLRVKLPHLRRWEEERLRNAEYFMDRFKAAGVVCDAARMPVPEGALVLPAAHPECRWVVNQFVIRVKSRDALVEYLKRHDVGCEIYYPVPLHLQRCFAYLEHGEGEFPVAEMLAKESLALPIYPELTDAQKDKVVRTVVRFLKGG